MPTSQKNGYSLIELIIAIAMITIVSSVFLVAYKNNYQKNTLNLTKEKIASDIRLSQNLAMSGKKVGLSNPYGWGVYLDKVNNSYIVFADLDDDKAYNNSSENFKEVHFSSGISINNLKKNSIAGYNTLNLLFSASTTDYYVDGIKNSSSSIELLSSVLNSTSTININSLGTISF